MSVETALLLARPSGCRPLAGQSTMARASPDWIACATRPEFPGDSRVGKSGPSAFSDRFPVCVAAPPPPRATHRRAGQSGFGAGARGRPHRHPGDNPIWAGITWRPALPAVPPHSCGTAIPGTTQYGLESRGGQPFRLFLHIPAGEPPPGGWPMITVLDANAVMGMVVDTVRVLAFLPREAGIRSAAVVAGIGYRTEGPYDLARRSFDLTPPPGRDIPAAEGRPGATTGGADELLDFIEEVVKPLAARAAPIDPSRHAVLGHSLGGLFTLHAPFRAPGRLSGLRRGQPCHLVGKQRGPGLRGTLHRADRPPLAAPSSDDGG
jgi:hypothetical protein